MKPDLSKYSCLLATVVIAGGILVLTGWQFDIDLLKRPVTGTAAMNPTSALCFIFSGISFLLFTYRHRQGFVIASVLLAVFIIFIAVLRLSDPILQTGPDRILFSGKLLSVHLSGMRTARMAQNAAVNFLLTGIVLVMLHSRSNAKKTVLQLIAAFIALMALFSILGYIYNAPEFRGMLIRLPMAVPCAILFFILSFSFLLVYSKEGIVAELTYIYAGSVVARALLPFAILIPILLGYLNLLAHRYALFSVELGLMSLILSIIGIFIILIWYTARILNIRDKANKEAEEIVQDSEMQIKTIFNAAPDAVVVINEEGRIIQWNPRAELMFGWSFHEVTGKLLSETIIPERYREAHRKGMARYLDTGRATILNKTIEIQASTKDNKELDVALSISPTIVKGKHIFIGFIRDVSERKRLENEIRDVNANLEVKIEQRTAELERKNRDLEQFAYVASHDLQEPLRTTSSFVQLLREKYQGKLDEEANQILEYMVQGSERMKTLIKDLLDYSRIGRKIELLDIDCNMILKEVVADLDTAFREAEAMIMIDPLPQLRGYPTELKLLFQNLVSNALKFRRKNEPLVINISAKQEKNYWQFSVTDNGIGIDEKFKERIFIIFQRLHVQSEYDGSGIGLAHCKKIVELHNGTIWVESVPGKGSTFYFTIQLM